MTAEEAYARLKKRMLEIAVLDSTEDVLYWDEESYLPVRAADHRAEQCAQLSRIKHEWFTDKQIGDWLAEIEQSDLIADRESETAVNVREWRRVYDRDVKLPVEFVEEFTRVTTVSHHAWADARRRSDFSLFSPHLKKIVDLNRKKADIIGFETERYDALLDEFEPGAKTAEVETVFAGLRTDLVELIGRVLDAPRKPDVSILRRPYDVNKQRVFAETVAAAIGYDFRGGRFDETTHPCCNVLGPHDIRILTRYSPNDLSDGLYSAIHEAGHALYDMGQSSKEHWGTPMGESVSLGLHESQSRMWENMVGRSRPFWVYFFPQLRSLFHDETVGVTLDDFYGAVNSVERSLIRTEADEATYNLHVMLRFELERAIITGDIEVSDIPGEWNRRFKQYLGIEVDSDANGCLQDVHWSKGVFGYFPTYALGNLYAAQFYRQALKDLPGLTDDFAHGDFTRLLKWLGTNIHDQGFRYLSPELCERITGSSLSHRPLLDYLYEKYEEVYGISRG